MANEDVYVSGGPGSVTYDTSIIAEAKSYTSRVFTAVDSAGLESEYPFKGTNMATADHRALGTLSPGIVTGKPLT